MLLIVGIGLGIEKKLATGDSTGLVNVLQVGLGIR